MGKRRLNPCDYPGCNGKILSRFKCAKHYRFLQKTRVVSDGPLLSYWGLQERLIRIVDPYRRALLVATYLLASRQSEVIDLKKKDFSRETVSGKPFLIVNSPVKKNRKEKQKLFPVNIEVEHPYVEILDMHLELFEPEDYIFPTTRKVGGPIKPRTHYKYTVLSLGIDFNPHWLRKLRATHLINGVQDRTGTFFIIPPQPAHIIRRLMGWTDLRPWRAYERFMVMDTARSMIAGPSPSGEPRLEDQASPLDPTSQNEE